MTDTQDAVAPLASGDLTTLKLPQLQAIAGQLGITGVAKMRKADLLAAIHSTTGQAPRPAARRTSVATSTAAGAVEPAPATAFAAGVGAPGTVAEPAIDRSSVSSPVVVDDGGPDVVTAPVTRGRTRRVATSAATSPQGADASATTGISGHASDVTPVPSAEVVADILGELAHIATSADDEAAVGSGDADTPRPSRSSGARGADTRNGDTRGADTRNGDTRNADTRNADTRGADTRNGGNRQDLRGSDTRNADTRNADTRTNENRAAGPVRTDNRPQFDDDDDDSPGGRRRRGRNRDRKRRGRGDLPTDVEADVVSDDDVLLPVAGILDVLDNYAFVRTSGYLPGPSDVYVSLGQVKKHGLRKGDAVVGAVRQTRDAESPDRRQRFNALARVDTVNGMSPDAARERAEFGKLTPLYPQSRLRLETDASVMGTRIIDLVAPIGKGQRGLIVSPPKAGKTLILQAVANAITTNNPECHLMVVLVDERPEEVTDMQRTVKGEVIASTFDRPADDHTTVAELAIERAKRLVEMGHDVVVLLDSITRLGRAYNIAAPASGRILSGGVDSSALYPPKRFFGAARNIEDGGSLTILATALVETGSKMDEVIFEEFKGTGNMELRLSRQLADKRIFPAVDVNASGTRREEILMGKDELNVVWKLRRVMGALDTQQAIELLLNRVKETKTNAEFLLQVQKTSPVSGRDDD